MAGVKQTHNLGKIKKLIDLNGDSINFDLSFTVTCKDDTPFNALVVDQSTLDNGQELVYKEVKKTISGNILADKNVYQNYFLILKSDNPCDIELEIVKKDLPKTANLGTPRLGIPHSIMSDKGMQPQIDPRTRSNLSNQDVLHEHSQRFKINWTHILIGAICIGGLILLFYTYKNKDKDNQATNQATNQVANQGDLNNGIELASTVHKNQDESHFRPTLSYSDKINKYASESHLMSQSPSPYNLVDRLNKYCKNK
jgi:hypothetical protein